MVSCDDEVIVRHATREDIPTILDLIKALAASMSSTDQVQATPELLGQSICFAPSSLSPPEGEPPISATRSTRCLLLISPSSANTSSSSLSTPLVAGFALYYTNYSTWTGRPGIYLEDLFVHSAYRKRGHARRLMGELARLVRGMGGVRLDWSVLKENRGAMRLYEQVGGKVSEDWIGMRVQGAALDTLAENARGLGPPAVEGEGMPW